MGQLWKRINTPYFRSWFSMLHTICAIAIVLAGVGLAVAMYMIIYNSQWSTINNTVEQDAARTAYELQTIFLTSIATLTPLAVSLTTNATLTEDIFFSLNFYSQNSGIVWAPLVYNSSVDSFLARARSLYEGRANYTIKFANQTEEPLIYSAYMPILLSSGNNYTAVSLGVDLLASVENPNNVTSEYFLGDVANESSFGVIGFCNQFQDCNAGRDIFIVLPVAANRENNTEPNPLPSSDRNATDLLDNNSTVVLAGVILSQVELGNYRLFDDQNNDSHIHWIMFSETSGTILYRDPDGPFTNTTSIASARRTKNAAIQPVVIGRTRWLIVAVPKQSYINSRDRWVPIVALILIIILTLLCLALFIYHAREKQQRAQLLNRIYPRAISKQLARARKEYKLISDSKENACILFTDIAGFTQYCSERSPTQVVSLLNDMFSRYDELCAVYNIEKIKIIGDSYMAATGVHSEVVAYDAESIRQKSIISMVFFALHILSECANTLEPLGLHIRVGIHIGPVIAGVICPRYKPHFDIWGDTVNLASRMESTGSPGNIQVTNEVAAAVSHIFTFGNRRIVDVKGKGPTLTWRLIGLREDAPPVQVPTPGVPRYMSPEAALQHSISTSSINPTQNDAQSEQANLSTNSIQSSSSTLLPPISPSQIQPHTSQPQAPTQNPLSHSRPVSPVQEDTRPTIKYEPQTLIDRFNTLFSQISMPNSPNAQGHASG